MKRISLMAIIVFSVAFTACRETALHHGLSEDDANEIVVVLYQNGIHAEKVSEEKNQEVTWNIVVPGDQEAKARELLVENHLPRKLSLGLSGVCQDEGLIPTPKREKCRELLAYKGELINSLEKISGVVDADVVLTIPDAEEYLEDGKTPPQPTASVVIKTKVDIEGFTPVKEDQVQHFVANAVPGMEPGNVAVIFATTSFGRVHAAAKPVVTVASSKVGDSDKTVQPQKKSDAYQTIFGIRVHDASAKPFKKIALGAMGIFLFVSGVLIFVLYMQIRAKRGGPMGRPALTRLPAATAEGTLLEPPLEPRVQAA